jgi:tetratricopeptide (TPR) repeat protein
MGSRKTARRLLLTAVLLACASAGFGPAGGAGGKVTKEQLEYSKQMFSEGEAAMKAGDHATALQKYYEGYRYAPHLHVFTYSIGAAAEAMGDCRTAFTYYRMFLDLVPEHPERKSVQKKYDALGKTCRFDEESETVNTETEQVERARDRGAREGEEAMSDAVAQLVAAERVYTTAASKYPDGPFKRAAKRKKKDLKRMRKLATKLSVKLDEGDAEEGNAGKTLKEACREGVRLEHRIIEALEAVLEHNEDGRAQKVGYRVLRGAERDETTFEGCR